MSISDIAPARRATNMNAKMIPMQGLLVPEHAEVSLAS